MAFANFFAKSAMAASEVLAGFDLKSFRKRLNSTRPGLVLDAGSTAAEGRVAAELIVNLSARLYPRLAIVGPSAEARRLRALARAINPRIDLSPVLADATVVIAGTSRPISVSCPTVYVGSDGWIARISSNTPASFGKSANPFGASVAACLAAANAFRYLFADQIANPGPDDDLMLSALDFSQGSAATTARWRTPSLDRFVLIGAGAIGSAVVWALKRSHDAAGELIVVDPETIELTNLQRYLLASQATIRLPKVEVVRRALRGTRIRVRPMKMDWAQYLSDSGEWANDVLVAVDSIGDRISIQGSLPRWIGNAWTQVGDFGVSRHDFLESACLMCLYVDRKPQKSESQEIAEALGIGPLEPIVRRYLYLGTPLDESFIQQVAAARKTSMQVLLPFIGKTLRSLYVRGVCGGLLLNSGASAPTPESAIVPVAFQSALAGILLAAELVAHRTQVRPHPLDGVTRMDVLRPVTARLMEPEAKRSNCICGDDDYIAEYKRKYRSRS